MASQLWPLIEVVTDPNDQRGQDAFLTKNEVHSPVQVDEPSHFILTEDLFHPYVPDNWIDLVVTLAWLCPQHQFTVTTYNSPRLLQYLKILTEETEQQTAMRLAVAIDRGGLRDLAASKNSLDFAWPLANLALSPLVHPDTGGPAARIG